MCHQIHSYFPDTRRYRLFLPFHFTIPGSEADPGLPVHPSRLSTHDTRGAIFNVYATLLWYGSLQLVLQGRPLIYNCLLVSRFTHVRVYFCAIKCFRLTYTDSSVYPKLPITQPCCSFVQKYDRRHPTATAQLLTVTLAFCHVFSHFEPWAGRSTNPGSPDR
ncbi:hypothetical protein BV22DRAFT_1034662 [Leucogyrophana mollusca]|uniref:Uncharacterized protein n=1 Tax=Leucogyrophana mollusca TaxID=85980 RepID=A0ACB8BGN8_9AGAM|nr:hypothetical protein BV22DRAFT_1034662 [Leucogyrophana mollusca]